MPFTGSHPAAVLPLVGTALPVSALVIGSMVPDVPLYLPQPSLSYARTHSLLGVVTVDVVLGVIGLLLWHLLLARAADAVAPPVVRERLAAPRPFPLTPLAVVALVIGALTHVGWDELTHGDRWGAHHIAWLAQQHGPLEGTRWAQYTSTVLGALAIAVWTWAWWRRTTPHPRPDVVTRRVRHGALVALVAGVAAGAVWGTAQTVADGGDVHLVLFHLATHAGAVAAVAAVLVAIWVRGAISAGR